MPSVMQTTCSTACHARIPSTGSGRGLLQSLCARVKRLFIHYWHPVTQKAVWLLHALCPCKGVQQRPMFTLEGGAGYSSLQSTKLRDMRSIRGNSAPCECAGCGGPHAGRTSAQRVSRGAAAAPQAARGGLQAHAASGRTAAGAYSPSGLPVCDTATHNSHAHPIPKRASNHASGKPLVTFVVDNPARPAFPATQQ